MLDIENIQIFNSFGKKHENLRNEILVDYKSISPDNIEHTVDSLKLCLHMCLRLKEGIFKI